MHRMISIISLLLLVHALSSACSYGCLYCATDGVTCLFCDINYNYALENNSCVKVAYEKCIMYTIDGVCLKCQSGYYLHPQRYKCEEVVKDKLIVNCEYYTSSLSCMTCKQDFYISSGECVAVQNPLVGCLVYMESYSDVCILCSSNYRLARDRKNCILKLSISNCKTYSDIDCEKCISGYEYSDNYYITDALVVSNSTQKDSLRSWLYDNKNFVVNKCKKQTIENCKTFKTFNTCSKCNDYYFLDSTGKCTAYPLDGIVNCSVYSNPTKCLKCVDKYFLKSEGQCTLVVSIASCLEYDTKASTTKCTQCNNDSKLVSNSCVARAATEKFENCDRHFPSDTKCTTCAKNYRTTDDFLKCINVIENCNQYEFSNNFSTISVCKFCNDGYTYKPSTSATTSGTCIKGTVENCKTYRSNDLCYECKYGYSLQGTTCLSNNVVDNCLSYDRTKLHTCSTCASNYMLFGLLNICVETFPITNCDVFATEKTCATCKNGYKIVADPEYPDRNKCDIIPPSLFCLQYDETTKDCTTCEKDYVLESGVCKKTNDYLKEYCQTDNSDGKITTQDYSCAACKMGSYFVNIDEYFMCSSSHVSSITGCAKYRKDEVDLTIKCVQCTTSYYLNDLLECKTTCTGEYIASLEEITKNDSGTDGLFDTYEVSGLRKCLKLDSTPSNCNTVAVNTFFQGTSTTTDYVCVQCKDGYINVADTKKTTRYNTSLITLDGPFSTYSALKCQLVSSTNIKGTTNDSSKMIDNCQYYYKINKNGDDLYGCLSCKFGYTGVVSTLSTGNTYGYIERCEDISTTDCDVLTTYQGYTTDFLDVDDWQLPLETFLSCHKCIDTTKKPVLFVDYEHSRVSTGYGSSSATSYSKYYHWSTSLDHMRLTPYKISSDVYANGTGGRNIQCLSPVASSFSISSSSNFMILADGNVGAGCALLIANVGRAPNASCSNRSSTSSNLTFCQTVYCAACTPGYKKTKITKTYLDNTSIYPFRSPYYAYSCTAINYCSSGSSWVNLCSSCDTGYTWGYNATSLGIDYDVCVPTSISNCAAANSAGACIYCKKGFVLRSSTYCDKITSPFCADNFSIQTSSYSVVNSKEYNNMGTIGLYLGTRTKGCDQCQTGYTAFKMSNKMVCLKSQFLTDFTAGNETEPYIFISYCLYYSYDISTSQMICSVCNTGYVLTSTYKCVVQLGNLANCLAAIESVSAGITSYSCDTCMDGFIFLNSFCVSGTIVRCTKYTLSKTATTQTCEKCSDGYYVSKSECVKGNIANCASYDSEKFCTTCDTGYYAVTLKNSVSLCLAIPSKLKCLSYESENFISGDMKCSTCSQGHVAVAKTSTTASSYCFKFPTVENCLKYDRGNKLSNSSLVCTQCALEYYLDSAENKCFKRSKIDPKCNYLLISGDKCLRCASGYFLSAADSTCIKNPEGINNCRIYKSAKECEACTTNTYLSGGSCIAVATINLRTNCIYYNADLTCQKCSSGYALELGICNKGSIDNCIEYDTTKLCLTCDTGYLTKASSDVNICVKTKDENCNVFSTADPAKCSTCKREYYPKNGLCTAATQTIDHCTVYSSDTACSICNANYALSINGSSCDTSTFIDTYKDPYCQSTKLVSPAVCSSCKPGYYFKDKTTCEACEVTDKASCYLCSQSDPTVCLMCATGYYWSKTGCVENPYKNIDSGSGGSTDESRIQIRVVYAILVNFVITLVF